VRSLPGVAEQLSLYDVVGGDDFFIRLVDAFYRGVAADDVLLPLYPEQPDLSGARRRLTLFLIQYWGGPTTYSDERGHPRLRMRHMPFHLGPVERDRWLLHMRRAVEEVGGSPDVAETLMAYFEPAAEHLRNDTGLPISSPRSAQGGGPSA
jgi:hemoglobin